MILSLFLWAIKPIPSLAEPSLILRSPTNEIELQKPFELSILAPEIPVCACTLQIFFQPSEVEVVELPSSNYQFYGNRIIYTWHDATGGNSPIIDTSLAQITFKALQAGSIDFAVHATLFTEKQEEITLSTTHSLTASSPSKQAEEKPFSMSNNASDASLYALRINEEGLTPAFDPSITDYYFLAPTTIENLKVTALPQNANATVAVTGNTNIPMR